jgi:hypothetical protein
VLIPIFSESSEFSGIVVPLVSPTVTFSGLSFSSFSVSGFSFSKFFSISAGNSSPEFSSSASAFVSSSSEKFKIFKHVRFFIPATDLELRIMDLEWMEARPGKREGWPGEMERDVGTRREVRLVNFSKKLSETQHRY